MNSGNVELAFDLLIGELQKVQEIIKSEANNATQKDDYDKARHLLEQAKYIQKFTNEIKAKKEEWTNASNNPPRTRRKTKRLPRGERTPQKAFRIPILKALVQLGGKGTVEQVLDSVRMQMQDSFKQSDLMPLSDGKTRRWQNCAQWERYKMVQEGLLSGNSPRGVWEITEKGRKYLA